MTSADPMRMLYVGVLSTLLVLTGCLGIIGDDVVDNTNAEVSDSDFAALQTVVTGLETLTSTHTTDMVDLKVRVATLEAANAPDMSGYATQASLDAIEAQVSQLQSQYNNLQQNGGSSGGNTSTQTPSSSNNALPIIDFHFDMGDVYDQDDISDLVASGYTDASSTTVEVELSCQVVHPEGEAITSVGVDYDHDGITDISISTTYHAPSKHYYCGGEMWDQTIIQVPVSALTFVEDGYDGGDGSYLTLGLKATDASGDAAWDVLYDVERVIEYEVWMGINFVVTDHSDMISNSNDGLVTISYQGPTIGFGTYDYDSYWYNDMPQYGFHVQIQGENNDWSWNNHCQIGNYYDNCEVDEMTDVGYNSRGLELYDGGGFSIMEDSWWSWQQVCQEDWYYDDNKCGVNVYIEVVEFIDDGSGGHVYSDHLNTFSYYLELM
ncbi:MAG: hypothetical protein CMA84_06435 [Euryarchaeota archaeon]|nr:hypothetical protein [Euryarchaeota archaeon]